MLRTVFLAILIAGSAVTAGTSPPAINASNVSRLSPIGQIDFAVLAAAAGEITNGWFALSHNGEALLVADRRGGLHLLDREGHVALSYSVAGSDGLPANFVNGGIDDFNGGVWSIHTDGRWFYLARARVGTAAPVIMRFEESLVTAWGGHDHFWLDNGQTVTRLGDPGFSVLSPGTDRESVIRVGRIEPPLAVTVTEDGRVKRWNMESGEVTAEVRVEDGLPIYGQLNAGGDSHLIWRDPKSTSLRLLSFVTAQDRIIVPLDGTYIPFILLSRNADAIIGVNINDAPVVIAWDALTGQHYDLGEYRDCSRPPDMVRLSRDGVSLVIGCDKGLEFWRINSEG